MCYSAIKYVRMEPYLISEGDGFQTIKWIILKNQSHYRPEVPIGDQEVKVPRLRDNGPG